MGTNAKFRDLAIRTLIGEADGQPYEGQLAVAHVIKNRADSGAWGDASQGGAGRVILAPKQFSMWNSDISSLGKTIPSSDPRYERAGHIIDAVFNGQTQDPTGGATHYYNPSKANPGWGQGPGQMIGAHKFMKLPLTAGNTAGTATISPSTVGQGQSAPATPPLAALPDAAKPAAVGAINRALADAHNFLGKNEVPDHDAIADYLKTGGQNLDPHQSAWCAAFVSASLQREGLPVPGKIVADSQFAGGANARDYLTYGQGVTDPAQVQAGDILVSKDGSHVGFAEGPVRQGPNGPEVQILAGNEKDASGKYQPGSWTNPQTGQVANRSQVGDVAERWAPLSDFTVRRAPTGAPDAGPASSTAPAAAASAPVPAASATPASATAPGSSGGNFAVPAGGGAYPGSDKYSVIQGMTSGTGRNPMLYTAANFGNLFGGGAPSAPPAAAPAAAPSSQPASAPAAAPAAPAAVPINRNNPLPWQGPPQGPAMPTPWQRNTTDTNNPLPWAASFAPAPVSIPISSGGGRIRIDDNIAPTPVLPSVSANWGAANSINSDAMPNTGGVPGGGVTGRAPMTAGAPSMGFPAMQNPFGQPPSSQQVSQLPGSMFASAQNLIKYLFPSATG